MDSVPKILVISSSSEIGGSERVLINVLRFWTDKDFTDSCCVCLPGPGLFADFLQKSNFNVRFFNLAKNVKNLGDSPVRKEWPFSRYLKILLAIPNIIRATLNLRKKIREFQPQVVLANGFKAQILATLSSPENVLLIWFFQDFLSKRRVVSWLLPKLFRPSIHVIADSNAVSDDIQLILTNTRPLVWHNTVDVREFVSCESDKYLDDFLPNISSTFVGIRIGLVATFAKWKGHDVFLKAAKIVLSQIDAPIHFFIIGGPIYQSQDSQWSLIDLEKIAEDLGIAKKVVFTGFIKEMPKVYNFIDIVVHASVDPEPFGQVIIEGMACGKPVVISSHGGAKEVGTSGVDCIHYHPGDPKSLAEAIQILISNPDKRREIGKAARETIVKQFGSERVQKRWDKFFQEYAVTK